MAELSVTHEDADKSKAFRQAINTNSIKQYARKIYMAHCNLPTPSPLTFLVAVLCVLR